MHQVSRSLGVIWADLWREKLFRIGLFIKLILITVFIPEIQSQWFVTFVINAIEYPSLNPWESFIRINGDPVAYPYGVIMFIAHLPTTFVGWIIDNLTGLNYFAGFCFRLSLVTADTFLLLILLQQFDDRWEGLILHYWLSPLVIFITYWHGQLDIIPLALFIWSVSMLRSGGTAVSGIVMALAISAKHSMLIGLPFVFIYLWFKRNIAGGGGIFLLYLMVTLSLLEGFLLWSDGFQQMVTGNREIAKLYWLSIEMGEALQIYLTPLTYMLLLYFTWRLRRMSHELLMTMMGVAFSVIILLTPASPGWFVWLVPMLVLYLSRSNRGAIIISRLFSVVFITYHTIYSAGSKLIFWQIPSVDKEWLNALTLQSELNTLVIGVAIIMTLQMFRDGIKRSDYYQFGMRPLVVSVAGDMNKRQVPFISSLVSLFGKQQISQLNGDDYYHLNTNNPQPDPHTFDHLRMVRDLRRLVEGKWVIKKSHHNKGGDFVPEQRKNSSPVIIVKNAHSLYSYQLSEIVDTTFIISENSKLKSEKQHADVIFTVEKMGQESDSDRDENSQTRLNVVIKNGIYYRELQRVLIGFCGLQVNLNRVEEDGEVEFDVFGEVEPEDIKLSAGMVAPYLIEFIDQNHGFVQGVMGVMQLVILMEIDESFSRRRNLTI